MASGTRLAVGDMADVVLVDIWPPIVEHHLDAGRTAVMRRHLVVMRDAYDVIPLRIPGPRRSILLEPGMALPRYLYRHRRCRELFIWPGVSVFGVGQADEELAALTFDRALRYQ